MSDKKKAQTTNPLNDFQEGQWWIFELDNLTNPTHEQKRAVSVVHNMLRSAEQSSKEIERLNALVAMQAEALNKAKAYIGAQEVKYINAGTFNGKTAVKLDEEKAFAALRILTSLDSALSASSSTVAK